MIQQDRLGPIRMGPNLPISSLDVGGSRLPGLELQEVVVHREVGKHDSSWISCRFPTATLPDVEGRPISFRMGTPASGYYRFHGFVFAVEKSQKLESGVATTLSCIGATAQAKVPVFGLLMGVTAEQVAEKVLPGVGFSHYSTGSSAQVPRVALTGRNAWEALSAVVSETGRVLAAVDGALWIIDPLEELEKGVPSHSFRKSTDPSGLGSGERDLLDFIPGSVTPGPRGELPRTAWFASDGSVKTRTPKGSSEDSYWASDVYIPSGSYAQVLYDRVEVENKLSQTATARVSGTAGVVPGNVVNISTGVTSLLTDTYDGLWMVTAVSHAVSDGVFQSNLNLVRDKYRPPRRGTYEWFYEKDRRMYPTMRRTANDEWVSSWVGR